MKTSAVTVLIPLLTLAACGGGSGGSSTSPNPAPAPPPDETISGIWQGTLTGQQSGLINDVACLITQAEEIACLLSDPSTNELVGGVQGTVSVANTNQVSGSGSLYAATGFELSDGSTFSDFTIASGTVDERNSLDLVANGGGEIADVNLTFDPLYDRDATLAAAAGVYNGFTVDGEAASFSIDGNGDIFAQSQSGCTGNGQIAVADPQFNEYSVTLTVSNCPGLDGSYNGLAITDDFAATDDQLTFAVFAGQQAILGAVTE